MGREVKCPFYEAVSSKWINDKRVYHLYCEGGRLRFDSKEGRKSYMNKYCKGLEGHKCCSIAAALYWKYEKEDD